MKNPKEVMKKVCASLGEQDKENLRWHAENGTKILCGGDALAYLLDGGA